MRGHIRQRGKVWSFVIELGNQKTQRCLDCNKRHWVERRPYEKCERCGGELRDRVERRQREETGFRTRKEAEAALTTELGKIQTQTYIPPSKITVREYLTDEWLPAVKGTVKPTTYLNYEIHVGRHINPVLGNIPLQKLSAPAINALYARLLTEPRKPVEPLRPRKKPDEKAKLKPKKPASKPDRDTVPESSRSLSPSSPSARSTQPCSKPWSTPSLEPEHPQPGRRGRPSQTRAAVTHEMKTWSAKELQAFLVSTRDTRFYPLWLLLASTGMRRGEALGLRWEDVDMENARLSIRQNMVPVGYVVHIGKPKNGRARNVSVDPTTLSVLKAQRKKQLEEQMLWKKAGYVDSGYVFRQENGLPYHPDFVTQSFQKAVAASVQPRIRLHDLRHTHATLALQAGIHPKVVSERLGHANISITLDVYSHAVPAMEEEAAAKIAALFMPG